MKKTTLLLGLLVLCSNSFAQITKDIDKSNDNKKNKTEMKTTTDKSQIEDLLSSYIKALNASDVSKTLALYTSDGTLMPNGAPLAQSQANLNTTYQMLFKAFKLEVVYVSEEIIINGNYAFARTSSKGSSTILASGETIPVKNKELFIFRKDNGQWKISHYMFNSNKMK